MRRRKSAPRKSRLWSRLLWTVLCVAAGGAMVWLLGPGGGRDGRRVPDAQLSANDGLTGKGPAGVNPVGNGPAGGDRAGKGPLGDDPAAARRQTASMSRPALESEVLRLQTALDERDKQISDLMIQIKLMNEGSSAPADRSF
jgi:hypothetical protein